MTVVFSARFHKSTAPLSLPLFGSLMDGHSNVAIYNHRNMQLVR